MAITYKVQALTEEGIVELTLGNYGWHWEALREKVLERVEAEKHPAPPPSWWRRFLPWVR